MNTRRFKNIIFDLGNVIVDLDLEKTERELDRAVGGRLRDKLALAGHKDLFEEYEVGLFSDEHFFKILKSVTTSTCGTMRLVDSWNAMLLGTPLKRLEMLEQLKTKYQVYLLSNTNATHIEWVHKDLLLTHGIRNFDTRFFHKAYYSHLIGLRKPHAAAFEYVIHDAGLDPGQTLFIDDNVDNINGAKSVGLHVHHHAIGQEIVDWVSAHL